MADDKPAKPGSVLRDEKGRLLPGGQSLVKASGAKPGLRKTMLQTLREETDDGLELLDLMLAQARGTGDRAHLLKGKDLFEARRYLYERLYGKTPDIVMTAQLGSEAKEHLTKIATEHLLTLVAPAPSVDALPALGEQPKGEAVEAQSKQADTKKP